MLIISTNQNVLKKEWKRRMSCFKNQFQKAIVFFGSFACLSFYNYTSLSISFSTYSTVRTRFSPVSSMYSSVLLVIVSPKTFSLSLTVLLPGFVRTANLGKSALDGRSYKWGMQWLELVFGVKQLDTFWKSSSIWNC